MAIKQANKYTDKNRPSGYYMVNGKRRYWSAENQKYYADQVGSTDDTLDRMGIPNPAGAIKRMLKGDPEKLARNRIQLQIDERGGRGMQLPSNYREAELRAEADTRRSLGQSSNIPTNENEVPEIKRNRELKMLTDGEQVNLGDDQAPDTDTSASDPIRDQVVKNRPMNTAETEAAGKDPMHVWALHNQKMIRRNGNKKQNDILDEALAAKSNKSNLKASEQSFVKPNRERLTSDSRTSIFTGYS